MSCFLFWNIHPELFSEIKFRLMSSTQHYFPRKTIRLSVLENNMIYTYRSDWTVIIIVVSITCPWARFYYFLIYTFSIWLYVYAMIERKLFRMCKYTISDNKYTNIESKSEVKRIVSAISLVILNIFLYNLHAQYCNGKTQFPQNRFFFDLLNKSRMG